MILNIKYVTYGQMQNCCNSYRNLNYDDVIVEFTQYHYLHSTYNGFSCLFEVSF